MTNASITKIQSKLAEYRAWSAGRQVSACRLVQYCGVDFVGATDVPLAEVEAQIEGLLREAFYVDWAQHEHRVFLRVWESDGPEPSWVNVFAERPLADVDELLRRLQGETELS